MKYDKRLHYQCTEYKILLITLSWLPVGLDTWLDVFNVQYAEPRLIYEFITLFNENLLIFQHQFWGYMYLNIDSILAWGLLYSAEICRRTKDLICHFMIRIFVFIDWLIYCYIDTTQRDGSYKKNSRFSVFLTKVMNICKHYTNSQSITQHYDLPLQPK
jgi:hypothetical protein